MAQSLKNGRFTGINASRFQTNKGVTEALDTSTGETVILKSFTITHEQHYEAAKEEAETLRQLKHENVVRYVDFIDELTPAWNARCSMCFIAMERCAGGSLVQWIEKMKATGRRTTAAEARIIAAQLVSALSFCHELKIGHLDLKPGNVFIMADFIQIKLGDFGSALTIRSAEDSLKTGASSSTTRGVGALTPLYAAPEFYSGEKVKKSPRLDIWGFGLILQEVLSLEHAFGRVAGRPAFHTQIQTNIQLHENPDSKRTSLFEIFDETNEFSEFEELLVKCLRADGKERPRDATQLKNEIVLVDFLNRLECGERPCDLVSPPFEDGKDTQIRELKEELAKKDRKIAEGRQDINKKDEIIEKQRITISKLESDLRENKKIIEGLHDQHETQQYFATLYKGQLREKKNVLEDEKANIKALTGRIQQLEQEKAKINASHMKMTEERQQRFNQELDRLANESSGISHREFEDSKSRIRQLEQTLFNANDSYEEIKRENEMQKEKIKTLESTLKNEKEKKPVVDQGRTIQRVTQRRVIQRRVVQRKKQSQPSTGFNC